MASRPRVSARRGVRRRAPALGCVLAAAAWANALAASPAPAAHVYPPLFGTREVESGNLKPFAKWLGVIERYREDGSARSPRCRPEDPNACHVHDWRAFLDTLEGDDRMTQLQLVNRYMNEHPYVIDPVNYHVLDYWATPKQFLDIDGDCEDYAIAKYYSLRLLGFDRADMRVVVLQDLNLGLPHAILVVYMNGAAYVLDNQIPQVVTADIIHHYRPYYSINEEHWWLHRRL
jgi:predicted transglutaminase-like cysteine proteinase